MKKTLTQMPRSRLRWLTAGAAALVSALAAALLLWSCARLADRPDQQAAQRWTADGTAFAQISLFLPQDNALTPQALQQARARIDSTLTQASLEPANENARLWLDTAAAELDGTASTDRGTVSVAVTAVDGDFFHFHPQQLKSGSTFSAADERRDTIVLDELAAWQLFGSPDVTGRPVTLNGTLYYVCGVTAAVQDDAAALTYGEKPRVWIFYESLPVTDTPALTHYEAVLPQPYSGYALQLAQEIFGTKDRPCTLLENTVRFEAASLWDALTAIPRATMREDGVAYPWWENAARYAQMRAALAFGAALLLLVWPAGFVIFALAYLWKRRRWRLRDVRRLIDRAIDRRRTAAWNAAQHPNVLFDTALPDDGADGYTPDTSAPYNEDTAPVPMPEENTEEAAP